MQQLSTFFFCKRTCKYGMTFWQTVGGGKFFDTFVRQNKDKNG